MDRLSEVAVACEYGRDNGDGTYSVYLERYPLAAHVRPVSDHPVSYLCRAEDLVAAHQTIADLEQQLQNAGRRRDGAKPGDGLDGGSKPQEKEVCFTHEEAMVIAEVYERMQERFPSGGEGNAPGHSHKIPGVWDDANHSDLAGKPCDWCALWSRLGDILSSHGLKA